VESDLDLDSWIAKEAIQGGWSPYGLSTERAPRRRWWVWNPNNELRPYRRTLYSMRDWEKHRSMTRYLTHLASLPGSGMFRSLLPPLAALTAWAAALAAWAAGAAAGALPAWVPPGLAAYPSVSMEPFHLTAFAMSLLLGFRTNIAHERWAAARGHWADLVSTVRSLCRLCMVHTPSERAALRSCTWLRAFTTVVLYRLREDPDVAAAVEGAGLSAGEAAAVVGALSPGALCLQEVSFLVKETMDGGARQTVEAELLALDRLATRCDGLVRSPVPLFYTQHLTQVIVGWLGLLPLPLVGLLGWQAVPAVAGIGFVLMGLDEIGQQIEEPFGILPLESTAQAVETDVDTLVRARAARRGARAWWRGGGPAAPE